MRKLIFASAVFLFLLPFVLKGAEPLKIAVVDVQEVIDNIEEGKQAKTTLERDKKTKEGTLEDKKREYTKMEQELEKQRLILSQDAVMEKQKLLTEKMRDIQSAYLAANDELNKKYNDALLQIYRRIEGVVTKIAKESDYSMVLEKGEGRGVMYTKIAYDITKKVVDTYNQVYSPAKGAVKK